MRKIEGFCEMVDDCFSQSDGMHGGLGCLQKRCCMIKIITINLLTNNCTQGSTASYKIYRYV